MAPQAYEHPSECIFQLFESIQEGLFLSNGQVRYNCSIIDLYDRSVVASENGRFITSDLAIQTLDKAIHAAHCDPSELILHSDQGV